MNRIVIRGALMLASLFFVVSDACAQGTAFTYQGRLNDAGAAATGAYDLKFALYDASTNGNAISGAQTNAATGVTNGLFTSTLDFGSVFTGTNYWLALGVRTNGNTNAFTVLWPRQLLAPVPYAIFANSASNLIGRLATTQLVGTLPSAQVSGNYSGAVNFTNGGNAFSGTFFGNGLFVNNLNASNLTSGTVADARLTTNVALLDHNQTFTGQNSFTNRNNSFVGSFYGNGLVGWQFVTGTVQQASIDTGYIVTSSNLTTIILPTDALGGEIVRISGASVGGWRIAQNAGQSIAGTFYTASNSTWVKANAANLGWQAIAAAADGLKMVASASGGGGLYTSTDAGKNWSSVSTTFSPTSLASSADGNHLFGATVGGGVIISADSGVTWKLLTPGNYPWTGIAASGDGSTFAACISNAAVYVWSNYGASSNYSTALQNLPLAGVASSQSGTRLAAIGYGGGIYLTTNAGANWSTATAPTANWSAITMSADGTKLAATVKGGRIYTSADAGASWIAQSNAPAAAWSALAASSDGGRLAAVINNPTTNAISGIYFSANYGLTWTLQSLPLEQHFLGVAASDDGAKVAAVCQNTTVTGKIYAWQATPQNTASTKGTNGSVTGSFGSAVELQYLGDGRFMPVSSSGIFWAN